MSASSVLELEIKQYMFWNCLMNVTFYQELSLHTLMRKWILSLFWVEFRLKKKKVFLITFDLQIMLEDLLNIVKVLCRLFKLIEGSFCKK